MRSNKGSFMKFESVKYPESHLVEWALERRHCLNSRTKVANKDRQQKQIFSCLPSNVQIYKYIETKVAKIFNGKWWDIQRKRVKYSKKYAEIFKGKLLKYSKEGGWNIQRKMVKYSKESGWNIQRKIGKYLKGSAEIFKGKWWNIQRKVAEIFKGRWVKYSKENCEIFKGKWWNIQRKVANKDSQQKQIFSCWPFHRSWNSFPILNFAEEMKTSRRNVIKPRNVSERQALNKSTSNFSSQLWSLKKLVVFLEEKLGQSLGKVLMGPI